MFEAFDGVSSTTSLRDLLPVNDVVLRLSARIDLGNGNYQIVKASELPIKLRDITTFYDVFEVQATDPITGNDQRYNPDVLAFDRYKQTNQASLPDTDASPFSRRSDDYLLFVHGWNMSPEWKRAYADTTVKRLYWAGYEGRIGMFNWPTFWDDGINSLGGLGPDWFDGLVDRSYNASDFNAYRSASALTHLYEELNGKGIQPSVLAHSMGNVVVGESLRLWSTAHPGQAAVSTYISLEGAMAADAYGHLTDEVDELNFYWSWPANAASTSGPQLLSGVWTAAQQWINIFNPQDDALNAWRFSNGAKIRIDASGNEWPYDYGSEILGLAPGFYRYTAGNPRLEFAESPDRLRNDYEILAFFAHSNSGPIGHQPVNGWDNIYLGSLGYSPDMPGGTDVPNHSYPFHYEVQTTLPFWKKVVERT